MTEDKSFSQREAQWMKIGAITEECTDAETAARLGGLDFTVSLRDVKFQSRNDWLSSASRKMVVADDTEEPFEIVSSDYKIIQYADAFTFLNDINPKFTAAGTLSKRRQGFMVVQLPEALKVPEWDALNAEDPHDLYVIIRTSHDRTRATEVMVMSLRGRCMNQLPLQSFNKFAKQRWSVRHMGDVDARLAAAKRIITGVPAYAEEFAKTAQRLIDKKVTIDLGTEMIHKVVRESPKHDEIVQDIVHLWQTDKTVGYTDRAWGLLNAVSSYYEHERKGAKPESRFTGALAGSVYNAINKTLVHALRA